MGGMPYKILQDDRYFNDIVFDKNDIILEIGSSWYDDHTVHLYNYSQKHGVDFMTVDVVDVPGKLSYVDSRLCKSGSEWCKDVLPTLNKKVKILHLDNFDWMYHPDSLDSHIQSQIESYLSRGIVMNNENSQAEHCLQVQYCMPFMAEQSIVIMDDTYLDGLDQFWNGKCGTAVQVLLNNGYMVKNIWGKPLFNDTFGAIAWRGLKEPMPL